MGDEIANLQPRVVINQSTAPTGSDNQLKNVIWIDSSSGDTAKTYNTSTDSWSSIGGKPDDVTIKKDSNGNLQAQVNIVDVVGDFESDMGGWSGSFRTNSYPAYEGNYLIRVYNDSSKLSDVDLSQYDRCRVALKARNASGQEFVIDGTVKADDTDINGSWKEFDFEITSSNTSADIIARNTSTDEIMMDYCRLVKSNSAENVTPEAGN